jgi:hypothetical protein
MNDETPRATVRIVDGQIVLDDPDALAMARAVDKHNCRGVRDANLDRVLHFVGRMRALRLDARAVVIVVLNYDDVHGGELARAAMPDYDFEAVRARGEVPFARGLIDREGMEHALSLFDVEAHEKLRGWPGIAVVVVDFGVAEVFGVAS